MAIKKIKTALPRQCIGLLAILLLLAFSGITLAPAFADDEQAINLSDSSTASTKSDFPNPYEFTRDRWLILIPVVVLAYAALHFIAYPYLRVKKTEALADLLPKAEAAADEV
jgi:hypothetical protein